MEIRILMVMTDIHSTDRSPPWNWSLYILAPWQYGVGIFIFQTILNNKIYRNKIMSILLNQIYILIIWKLKNVCTNTLKCNTETVTPTSDKCWPWLPLADMLIIPQRRYPLCLSSNPVLQDCCSDFPSASDLSRAVNHPWPATSTMCKGRLITYNIRDDRLEFNKNSTNFPSNIGFYSTGRHTNLQLNISVDNKYISAP